MPSEAHEGVVAMLRANAGSPTGEGTFESSRENLDATGALFSVAADVHVLAGTIAGVLCERLVPGGLGSDAPRTRVLYLHGGSYTAGSLASHRSFASRIAAGCSAEVVTAHYGLAPEHPYPEGINDAQAVYLALLAESGPDDLLLLMGDSAGGGLSAGLLVRLRDEGTKMPDGAVLFSPWLDLTLSGPSITELADADPMLTAKALAESAAAYAGTQLKLGETSPLFADLTGFPPILLFAGTAEILLDDSRVFAERLRAAGIPFELVVGEGLIHVWPFVDGLPESTEALAKVADWVSRR